ncbi:MAG: ABC transporter ATP-binding protein [candidate division Zixibacteria bacterium]
MLNKLKWIWEYYKRYPYVLAVLLILTPVQAAIQVTVPRIIEFAIDFAKTGKLPEHRAAEIISGFGQSLGISLEAAFTIAWIGVGLISFILYTYVQSHRAWMNLKLEWLFRQDAFKGITAKGPDFFNRFRTGDLLTRLTDDVAEKLSWFACSGIFRFYEAMLMVVFTITMMTMIDPILTLWTAGPLPILIIVFFKSATILDKRYDRLQSNISGFNNLMEACFSGIRVVKAYVREKAQKGKFNTAARNRRTAEISAVKATIFVDSLYFYIWQFGIIIALMAGGYKVINADLSLGELMAFIFYVIYLVFPMFDIGQFLVKSRQSAVSINRLLELENVPPMIASQGDGNGKPIEGNLSFENVDFEFQGSERKIVDNIHFDAKRGQTIALVGKIGSGKSWLVNMIPRLVDPTGGIIKLGGRGLKEYSLEDLRNSVGYVPQEPVLFSDTVENNIRFGRDDIDAQTIDWAIEVSQLKNEIDGFPEGLDTKIGVRGMSISGGQKQRLALARALVGKPRILILDDCTSALDSTTESALWDALHEVLPGIMAIIITHRPDTLERADNIIVLEDGRIVETGNHDELMNNGGRYAKIYRRYKLEETVK